VFLAIPFAVLLTILFYFDHNVSSLISQGTEFPLKKPAGFHWDFFLLGITTGVAGLLGIPAPNGLIPQAPFHTTSLCVTRKRADGNIDYKGKVETVIDHVVEQRISNLAQGLLTLGTMTGPLLVVLGLIPQAVMAGLFFVMGLQALEGNGLTLKMLYLVKERALVGAAEPLRRVRNSAIWRFVTLELLGFGVTFAITQTIAAVGFPVIILILIPVRTFVMPAWFRPEELSVLDSPTASAFTLESVGGSFGSYGGTDQADSSGNSTAAEIVVTGGDENVMERGELARQRKSSSIQSRPEGLRSGLEDSIDRVNSHSGGRHDI